jgi:nitrite reductase/ring-hydroxylating ferredoxin subunit
MAKDEILVAKAAELGDGDRKIVRHGEIEIGVYHVQGKYYAYRSLCAHQGGPACEGLVMPKVEEVIAPDKTYHGMRFNYDELHIVCPWHGWEYDLKTGEMVADRKLHLHKYDVIEKGGDIYVVLA